MVARNTLEFHLKERLQSQSGAGWTHQGLVESLGASIEDPTAYMAAHAVAQVVDAQSTPDENFSITKLPRGQHTYASVGQHVREYFERLGLLYDEKSSQPERGVLWFNSPDCNRVKQIGVRMQATFSLYQRPNNIDELFVTTEREL